MTGASILEDIRLEFPAFRIVYKRINPLCHAIHWGLVGVTLGRQREFLTSYYTVIGNTLYVPDSWDRLADVDRAILLRHERVHLRQRSRYGSFGMAILYLFPFFPIGLAYGRARLEWEAYRETLRATAELKGLAVARHPALREQIVERFVGPAYAWMWPFRKTVERWYSAALADLVGDDRDEPLKPAPLQNSSNPREFRYIREE